MLVTLFAAACDEGTTPDEPATTEAPSDTEAPPEDEAPPETEAPSETEAPDTTATTDGSEDAETPWWVLILVGIGLLILVVVLTSRGSKNETAVAVAPTWKDRARAGYADSRWLYDNMTEDIAVWRGNAKFEGTADAGSTAGTSKAQEWAEITTRQQAASDELYALEAAAPDNNTVTVTRNAITAMRATREAVDARAEARYAYRTAEAAEAAAADLTQARDREVRASRNLADTRSSYARALTDLSTIV